MSKDACVAHISQQLQRILCGASFRQCGRVRLALEEELIDQAVGTSCDEMRHYLKLGALNVHLEHTEVILCHAWKVVSGVCGVAEVADTYEF